MKLEIPRPLLEIMEKLEAAGYETVAVGGCVRDCLLGKQPHDWDMATAATPEEMKQVLSGYRLLETGLRHGTLTVLHGGEQVEITASAGKPAMPTAAIRIPWNTPAACGRTLPAGTSPSTPWPGPLKPVWWTASADRRI